MRSVTKLLSDQLVICHCLRFLDFWSVLYFVYIYVILTDLLNVNFWLRFKSFKTSRLQVSFTHDTRSRLA